MVDNAFRLATMSNTVFRRDKRIENILKTYDDLAKENDAFSARLRAVIKSGYLDNYVKELDKADLQVVRGVSKLIGQGRLEEALRLNTRASEIFDKVHANAQVVNGVTANTFKGNEEYIRSLSNAKASIIKLQ